MSKYVSITIGATLLAGLAASAGCFEGEFPNCTVMCATSADCPDALSCSPEGVCSRGASSCDGNDCEALCTAAKAGNCSPITGSCSNFCSALDTVQGPAGCTLEREAHETCLDAKVNVCDVGCVAEETALGNCLTAYCDAHASDSSCITLTNSL